MTMADEFKEECSGKTLKEIGDIEQEWYKAGKWNGEEGMNGDAISAIPRTLNGKVGGIGVNCEVRDIPSDLIDPICKLLDREFKTEVPIELTDDFVGGYGTGEFIAWADEGDAIGGEGSFSIPLTDEQADEIMEANTHNDMLAIGTDWTLDFDWWAENDSEWTFPDGSFLELGDIECRA